MSKQKITDSCTRNIIFCCWFFLFLVLHWFFLQLFNIYDTGYLWLLLKKQYLDNIYLKLFFLFFFKILNNFNISIIDILLDPNWFAYLIPFPLPNFTIKFFLFGYNSFKLKNLSVNTVLNLKNILKLRNVTWKLFNKMQQLISIYI